MNEALLEEISSLKKINLSLEKDLSLYKEQAEKLQRLLITMKREKFGRKSERVIDDGTQQTNLLSLLEEEEKSFFNEAEVIENSTALEKEEIEISYKRKKGKKTPLHELPIDEVRVNDLSESEKQCPEHHTPLIKVGENVVLKLEIIPKSKKVVKIVTPIYGACSDFCGQEQKKHESFDILPNTAATPSLLSNMLISKFEFALPFYRIEKLWERIDIDITRATMARWTIDVSSQLVPLINLMNEDLMMQGYFQCDETYVNVLKLNGEQVKNKSYIWTRYSPVVPIVLYEFHPTRSGQVPKAYLQDYQGYMQVDGYQGYNVINNFEKAFHVCCWAHARKLIYKAHKDEKSRPAYELLKIIKKLFKVDEEAQDLKLTFEERKRLRDEKSKPVIDEIKKWIDEHKPLVRPNSYLGQGLEYILNRWDKLTIFLEDGRIELSTNLVENKIRPFTIGRKNWLFFDTDKGADAGCIIYSLIETAKANNKNPQKYLEYVFTELPKAKTLEDLEKLLPYDRSLIVEKF